MKKRFNFTPIIALIAGGLILIISNNFIGNDNSKRVKNVHRIDKKTSIESDSLVALPPVEFDSLTGPTLLVRGQKEKAVALSSLSINSTIRNNVAVTRYEMTFHNKENRDLEAELNFPLGQGQTITYFAMDINGKMRPGVAVEKEKARVAFETTIRQNIDPGLVEMTKGNNFKARVFPVPSNGFKRVIIEYTEELIADQDHAYYYLPLKFKNPLNKFDLVLKVLDEEVAPEIFSTNSEKLKFQHVERQFIASIHKRNFTASEPITITTPVNKTNPKAIFEQEEDGYYFHTSLNVPHRFRKKEKPKSITVFWDASNSRKESSRKKEIELLTKYISYLENVSIEVIPFANTTLTTAFFSIKNGNTKKLTSFLNAIFYDGGSNLKDLAFDKTTGEEILLFSDGLTNLGSGSKISSKKRIYTISSSASSDQSLLTSLADGTDAVSIDLSRTPSESALNSLKMDQLHFMGFTSNKGVKEYYPKKGIPARGILGVSGKMSRNIKDLTARYGYGNTVVLEQKITLNESKNKGQLKKLLALKKISFLDQDYEANKKEITSLGLEHRLVTRNTSLLVLDRIEDYVEHEIVPPADLQNEYFKLLKRKNKKSKAEDAQHMKNVLSDFKEQKTWWSKKAARKKLKTDIDPPMVSEMRMAEPSASPRDQASDRSETMNMVAEERTVNFEAPVLSATTIVSNVNGTSTTYAFNAISTGFSSDGLTVNEQRGTIHVKGWDPKSPYMKKIKNVSKEKAYTIYLMEKTKYGDQPSFFLDVADYFISIDRKKEGLRILSNIAELELENHSLLRILAHKLLQLGETKIAIQLFKELIDLRPEEPQSYRDLGLAYAEIGENDKAVRMLYKVVTEDFDERFRGIEVIAMNEINNILAKSTKGITTSYIDKRLLTPMPVDIRVVLNWDADNTDVDLWVTDPNGEKCFYSNKYTAIGGRISNDFTQGYGPEEFMIRKAIRGKYKIQAHYYGSSSQSIQGKATLSVQFFKQFGSKHEEKQEVTRRLNVTKDVIDLGEFVF